MGRTIRQKRKGRSSRPTVKQSNSRKRPLNPTGNIIIAENWDKKQTLSQNYRRLGLMNRLNHPTGGIERLGTDVVAERKKNKAQMQSDPLRIDGKAGLLQSSAAAAAASAAAMATAAGGVGEVRVERDAEGKIVRVVRESATEASEAMRPVPDLLSAVEAEWEGFSEGEDVEENEEDNDNKREKTAVVSALEALSRQPVGPKHVRHQSEGERSWLQQLVAQYGTADPDEATLAAMARDRRRNPMQRTAADLGRRLAVYRTTVAV